MLKILLTAFALCFLAPLGLHAAYWTTIDHGQGWAQADWSSARLLPAASAKPQAIIHVYAGRVGRWRGVFAHHTWIVVKEKGASRYTRFDKVAWGMPVKVDGWAPDGRWYGHEPELIGAIEGPAAEALIPKIRAAVTAYPYNRNGGYSLWPGPNSNSFVAHVLEQLPQTGIALPPTAIGKDWRTDGRWFGRTPSGTGYQLSLAGLLGVSVGLAEGIEINILGLVFGVDVMRPALKLPGFGRIGMAPHVA
ncbi:MAG: DUF3750 domain-containing protein [Hyphomicrobiaceae bacterium]